VESGSGENGPAGSVFRVLLPREKS
jgi:hypothetical protein